MKVKQATEEMSTTMELKCPLEGWALINVTCKLIHWGEWVEQKIIVKYAQAAV